MSVSTQVTANIPEPGASGTVTLSGETINDIGSGNRPYRAALVVYTDGTCDKIENLTTTQIDSSTDWIIPNGDASSLHEVRYTNRTGSPLDVTTSLAEDTWGFISSNRFFEQRLDGISIEGFSSSFTVEIRYNGGSVLDSATYALNVERLF